MQESEPMTNCRGLEREHRELDELLGPSGAARGSVAAAAGVTQFDEELRRRPRSKRRTCFRRDRPQARAGRNRAADAALFRELRLQGVQVRGCPG
jgi:hypothetical protein